MVGKGLHGPGLGPRPVPGQQMRGDFFNGPGRQMRNEVSNRPGRQMRCDFSNGPGRHMRGEFSKMPVRAGKKRNEFFNGRVWLQKKLS